MKNILILFCLCVAVLLPAGCWDRREVNDLALVMAVGIDKKSANEIELSVQVIDPKKFSGGQVMGGGGVSGKEGTTFVRSAEGVTIADATARLQEKFPRSIFWGQTNVFIIGEELAKAGIQEEIEFLARNPQSRLDAFVFVSKGKAADILELSPPLERYSAEVLREMAEMKNLIRVTLKDLLQTLSSETGAAVLPWVEISPSRLGHPEKEQMIPYVAGTAVFKKAKMVGHIDDKLTRGLLWIRDEIETAMVTVTPKEAEGYVSLYQLRANTKQDSKIEQGKWKITLKVETEDDVIQNTTNLNLMNPKFVKMVEKDAEEVIANRMRMAIAPVQKKMNADIFGFGEAFHRKYPKEWERVKGHWDEIFPELEVKVEVKSYIRRPGKATVPAGLPKEEVKEK